MTTRIGDELQALRASDGRWYPSIVVDWARANPDSALYRALEWDDRRAADEHRLSQARQLIAIHIVDEQGDRSTIALVIDRGYGGGYRDLGEVLSNAQLRRLATEQALAELRRWQERNKHLVELDGVFRAIGSVTRRLDDAA